MRKAQIEPGMLSLFRLTYGLWMLTTGAELIGAVFSWNPFEFWTFLNTVFAASIVWYLYSNWLQYRLARWYLPTALVIASLGPIVGHWLRIGYYLEHGVAVEEFFSDYNSLFEALFIPAIIITVQYSYRAMLGFTVGTGILQIVPAIFWPYHTYQPMYDASFGDAMGRIVFFPVIGFFVVRLVSGQKKERKALAAKNVELTHYATTVERLAISHERNRLARELHDTLAHTLSAVAVQVEALNKQLDHDPASAKQTVQQLRDLTRSGLQESRRALQALRASPLEGLGLTLAMQQLIDSTAERSGLPITFNLPDELDELTPEVEQSIYRITEEALNNTVRHARAQRVTVSLVRELSKIHLTITDDGFGFHLADIPTNGHYGLVGMRERALLCNGQLDIASSPATGTTISLTVEA